MVFIRAFRFVAAHPPMFLVLLFVYSVTLYWMNKLMAPWESAPIPDLKFGFTGEEIEHLMKIEWGKEGCDAYVTASTLDLFPYMECYGLVLGGLLILASQRQQWDERVALLIVMTVLMDVGETGILHVACLVTDPLAEGWIRTASLCNQAKWTSLAFCGLLVATAFILPKKKEDKTS